VREAKKKGLDKTPEVKNQMDLTSQTVLVRAYVSDWMKTKPDSGRSAAQGI
jgi:peptidyl-prolyl cis-trans isomerase C